MNKKIKLLIIFLSFTLLTGCWDKVEIEDRAYVSAVGLDVFKEKKESKGDSLTKEPKKTESNKYTNTYVFPNLKAIGKNPTSDIQSFVVSSVGRTPYETTRELTTRLNKVMFFRHLKVIVLGRELAEHPDYLKEQLDALERHGKISRKINLFIAKGTAKEVINIKSQFEPVTGTYLSGISEKKGNISRFNHLLLGDLLEELHNNKAAIVPRVIPSENEVKIAGSAIIKDYKLIGWLGELENRDAMFLKDEVNTEIVNVVNEDILIPYIISDSSTKIKSTVKDQNIKVQYIIEMEGFTQQYKLDATPELLDDKTIRAIENKIEEKLEKEITYTINKLQKEFKVDVIGVGDHISKFYPKLWSQIEKDFEEMYPYIDINVKVNAKLRRIGLTK